MTGSPHGQSVNNGINPEKCSLRYASIDQAINLCRSMGDAPLLSKLDIKSAYRIVPVHPDNRHVLGMHWQRTTYIDTALPFGLRSALKVFSAVADALLWAMHQEGVTHGLHYLDDFLFVDRASTKFGESQLLRALHTCQVIGVPVAPDKVQHPTNVLTFLGIEIDTSSLQLRLPRPKLLELRPTLERWRNRISGTKRVMLSLVGKLQHAAGVVKPGRTFLRRLIDRWSGQAVRCHCDNSAVVSAVNLGLCREKHLMHLLRCLFFFAAHYRFRISAQHIPGADNVRADALSRGRISHFFSISQAEPSPNPTPFPHRLLELAADSNLDWTSPRWIEMFQNSLTTA